jgi:hypothetical protein
MAYSEQVGTYRQLGGSIGESIHLYPRNNSNTNLLAICMIKSTNPLRRPGLSLLTARLIRHFLANHLERPADFR